jgi:hypothetical protein
MLAVKLLIVAAVTWMACAAYTLWFNPEVRFYTQLSKLQDDWSRKMDHEHGNKVVVFGGSSCTFSINGEQMLEKFGLPTVNRGLAAGMGVKIPTLHAVEDLRRGDTLIVALEPAHFAEPPETTSLATQFSYSRDHSEWATRSALGLPGNGRVSTLLALRPGSYHALTLIGKLLQGRPLYRYQIADARPSGWVVTKVRAPMEGPPGHKPRMTGDIQRYLSDLRDWCAQNGVRVAYSLPWAHFPVDKLEGFKASNADILLQIREFIPVLKDPLLGADPEAEHFADTGWHLTEEGSGLRTDQLGESIVRWDLWSREELQSLREGR